MKTNLHLNQKPLFLNKTFMLKEVTKKQDEVDVLDEIDNEHKVILHNDDVNTFDYVIQSLIEVCKHDFVQAEQLTLIVHYKGKATVKTGDLEELTQVCSALLDRGLSAELK